MPDPYIDTYQNKPGAPAYGTTNQYNSPLTAAYKDGTKFAQSTIPYSPDWQERQGVRQQDLDQFQSKLIDPRRYGDDPRYKPINDKIYGAHNRTSKSARAYNQALASGMLQADSNYNRTLEGAFGTTATLEGQRSAERQNYVNQLGGIANTGLQGYMTGTSYARQQDMNDRRQAEKDRLGHQADIYRTYLPQFAAQQESLMAKNIAPGMIPTPDQVFGGAQGTAMPTGPASPYAVDPRVQAQFDKDRREKASSTRGARYGFGEEAAGAMGSLLNTGVADQAAIDYTANILNAIGENALVRDNNMFSADAPRPNLAAPLVEAAKNRDSLSQDELRALVEQQLFGQTGKERGFLGNMLLRAGTAGGINGDFIRAGTGDNQWYWNPDSLSPEQRQLLSALGIDVGEYLQSKNSQSEQQSSARSAAAQAQAERARQEYDRQALQNARALSDYRF